jgi:hypothetical protein
MRRTADVRQLLVLCLAATAAGCGQDDGEASSTAHRSQAVAGFVEDVAKTACKALKSCCASIDVELDSAGCRRVVPATLRLYYSSRVELKESKVSQCLEQVSESLAKCKGTWPPALPACHAALAGTVAQAEACSFDFECSAVKGKVVACSKGRCTTRDEEDDSSAASVTDWGQACSSGADCEGTCEAGHCTPGALVRTCAGDTLPVGPVSSSGGDLCIPGEPCPLDSEECVYDAAEHRYQCLPAGGVNMPCHGDETCDDQDLACANGVCLEAGGEEEPCRTDGKCGEGLVCANSSSCDYWDEQAAAFRCCIPTGGSGQPCGADGSCDQGLGCIASHECLGSTGTTECCLAEGDYHDPCNEQRGCATGYECREDTSCVGLGAGVTSCCVEVGGLGQLCPEEGACDEGLACVKSPMCSSSSGQSCCQQAGGRNYPCYEDGRCDEGFECRTSNFCMYSTGSASECCIETGTYGRPCTSEGSCDPGFACAGTGSTCSYGEPCCVYAGGTNEPCYEDDTCDENLSCVACDEGKCCQPVGGEGQDCYVDDSCNAGLVCCTSPDCTRSGMGLATCCLHAGQEDEPCLEDGTCEAADTACLSLQDVVSGSSYFECVGVGGPGEPCRKDESCEQGNVCVESSGGCGADACCVASGAPGQPCNADGTCDADILTCQDGICFPEP